MTNDPLRLIAAREGVFLYSEALAAGYTKNQITMMRRSGGWHRVRHGAYTFDDVWATLPPQERHLLLARAVLRTTPGPIALSHTTALLLHGVAVWGADLTRVHVTRLDAGAHRTQRDVVHHVGLVLQPEDVTEVAGLPVTVPSRAVIEHATIASAESSLVSADNALFLEQTSPSDLHALHDRFGHWPGSQHIHVMLHHMDGRHESVGETRSDHLFRWQGLPRPEPQWEVYDERGLLIARTDFVWHRYRLFGEFDGKGKYLRPYEVGLEPGDVVFSEKRREDEIRRLTGYGCIRIAWADLNQPARVAAYIRRLMQAAA